VLARIDFLTSLPASLDLRPDFPHAGVRLHLAVERRDDHIPPLAPLRVIAVVVNDEPLDAVIVGVNLRHRPTVALDLGVAGRQLLVQRPLVSAN
jgi:hypothetical protein